MSNVIPFPQRGGYSHHGAGGFNHHQPRTEYWWEVDDGSVPLPLFTGMEMDEVSHLVTHTATEIQVFEALLNDEQFRVLINACPAELCKPRGAILCCGLDNNLWAFTGKKWKNIGLKGL